MMQKRNGTAVKDCVLVAISRFDQLPLVSAGGLEALQQIVSEGAGSLDLGALGDIMDLGAAPAEPVSEESVLDKVRVLKEVVTRARDLTDNPERVMIMSAVRGLTHLQSQAPPEQVFGSPAFLRELDRYKVDAGQHVPSWKKLSDLLTAANSREGLGTWLADYCGDGGRQRLLGQLRRHVATHGLRRLKVAVDAVADEAEAAAKALVAAANPAETGTGMLTTDAARLDQLITDVANVYNAFAEGLEQSPPDLTLGIDGLLRVHQAVCKKFDLNVPPLEGHDGKPRPVYDVVREEVARTVFLWDHWQQMRMQLRKGRIPAGSATGGARVADASSLGEIIEGLTEEDLQAAPLPQRTEDFLAAFQQALLRCEWFARLSVQHAIAAALSPLDQKLAPLREDLRPLWGPGRSEQVGQHAGREAQVALMVLRSAVELKEIQANITRKFAEDHGEGFLLAAGEQGLGTLAANARHSFPLAQPSARHPAGRLLPWAASPAAPQATSHQVLMVHMRRALAASAAQTTSQLVSHLSQQVLLRLRKYCRDIYNAIVTARGKPNVRLALTALPPPADRPAAGNPYASLAAVRRPAS
jgi:hypothetical protein